MAVQTRQDNVVKPFILSDDSLVRNGNIKQNGSRTTDLLQFTVMAKNATTLEWVPFTLLNQTNGESVPRGIYMGDDIEAADLVAGAVEDVPILMGNATVDENQVIWDDDTLSADSIVNPANIEARTAREALAESSGIFLEDTVEISGHEN